jgi:hypothetical protein
MRNYTIRIQNNTTKVLDKRTKDWYYGRYRRRFQDYIQTWKTKEQSVSPEKYQELITPSKLAEQFDFSSDDNLEQNKKLLDDIFSNIKNKTELEALKNNEQLQILPTRIPKTYAYILNKIDELSAQLDDISDENLEIQE